MGSHKGCTIRYLGGGGLEFLLLANFFFHLREWTIFFFGNQRPTIFFYVSSKDFFVVCFLYYVGYLLVFFLVNIFFINFDNKLFFLPTFSTNFFFWLLWRQTIFFNFFLASPPLPPPQISNGASIRSNVIWCNIPATYYTTIKRLTNDMTTGRIINNGCWCSGK